MVKRYESSVTATSPQKLDMSNVRAAITGSQALESRLDRLTSLLYTDLEKEAKAKGLQYGVANRPSLEQIADATSKGEDPNQLFQKRGTVFGDAARQAQAEMVKQDFEYDLLNQLQAINKAMEAGADYDPDQLAADLETKINAISNVLMPLDPLQSMKLRSGSLIKANAVYNTALTNRVLKINAENINKTENAIRLYGDDLETMLLQTEGNVVDSHVLNTRHAQLINELANRVPSKKEELLRDFDNERFRAYKGAIKKYLAENDVHVPKGSHLLTELDKGNLGKMSDVYALLSNEEQENLKKEIITEYTNRNTLNQAMQTETEYNNRADISKVWLKRINGEISSLQAIDELTALQGPLDKSALQSLTSPISSNDNTVKNAIGLKREVIHGKASVEDIINEAKSGNITWDDAKTITDAYNTMTSYARVGLNKIRLAMGVNEFNDFSLIPRYKRQAIDTLSERLLKAASDAGAKGIAFDQEGEAMKLINEWNSSQQAENVKNAIDNIKLTLKVDDISENNVMNLWQGDIDKTREYVKKTYKIKGTDLDDVMYYLNQLKGQYE